MKIKNTDVEARHPWPEGCLVQGGGHGLVIGKTTSYTTAFVEAFPDTFIRGEGATIEEAEDSAWAQYQRHNACPGHEWEARGYKNGAGFCKHCGTFKGHAFAPEQLGLSCKTCDVPTYYSRIGDDFFCEEHAHDPDAEWLRQERRKQMARGEAETVTGSMLGDLFDALTRDTEELE